MRARWSVVLLAGLGIPAMAQPKADTVRGFERYGAVAEARIRAEQSSAGGFLRINALGGAERRQAEFRLRRGEVLIVRVGPAPEEVPGGLIHDWVGTAYLPETTIAQVLAAVQDYDHIAEHYRPEVEASRLISRQGDDFHVFLRLRKHKLVTVVLDTEYDVHYGRLDEAHWFSTSHSTRIDEVGGGDHGYLWRLNTYWRFAEAGDGVMVQCEAISLTRDIPTGLGWMIGPFVSNLPRESLTFTLEATRRAVAEAAKTRVIPTRGNALARDDR